MLNTRTLPSAFVAIILVASVCLVLLAHPALWVDTLFDDAYYYLGVARNISLGNGSVFASPLETNGYQPLWLLILTGASFLVTADHRLLVLATHVLTAVIIAGFFFVSGRQEGKVWPAALTVLAFPTVTLAGMETTLLPLLALLYFRADGWKRGGLASLIFLTRLDAVGLILGREVYQLLVKRTVDFRAASVLVAVGITYAAFNYAVFGTPVPVSGLAKSIGNVRGENWLVGFQGIAAAFPVLAIMILARYRSSSLSSLKHLEPLFASVFALGCSLAYYSVFSGWILWSWYFWPLALIFYFSLLEFDGSELGLVRTGRKLLVPLVVLIGMFGLWPSFHSPILAAFGTQPARISWGAANIAMVDRIANAPLKSATFAMGDRAGSLGFLLPDRFDFVQTEGLVANLEYTKALRSGTAEDFLARVPVDYLIIDRGQYWQVGTVYAVPEPIQGLSARSGVMLLCFPPSAIVQDFGQPRQERKVFVYAKRIRCPQPALALFRQRQRIYGEVRRTSLWDERPEGFFGALQ